MADFHGGGALLREETLIGCMRKRKNIFIFVSGIGRHVYYCDGVEPQFNLSVLIISTDVLIESNAYGTCVCLNDTR